MTWRLAKSLAVLRLEANTVAPGRDKSSDGTIGNAEHAARASRHNPNSLSVVCAMDLTHSPPEFDVRSLLLWLAEHPHPDLEYAITNRQIIHRRDGFQVRPYRGTSPHTHHIHVAVGEGPDREPRPTYDTLDPWGLAAWQGQPPEEDDLTPEEHKWLDEIRHTQGAKASYVSAITNALAIQNWDEAERLNDAFYERWPYPASTTGLPVGWRHA